MFELFIPELSATQLILAGIIFLFLLLALPAIIYAAVSKKVFLFTKTRLLTASVVATLYFFYLAFFVAPYQEITLALLLLFSLFFSIIFSFLLATFIFSTIDVFREKNFFSKDALAVLLLFLIVNPWSQSLLLILSLIIALSLIPVSVCAVQVLELAQDTISPLSDAGVEEGDIIVRINENRILTMDDLFSSLELISVNDLVTIETQRENISLVLPANPQDPLRPYLGAAFGPVLCD